MFDINKFKVEVKEWIKNNPDGSETELLDYCEEMIPAQQYSSHSWIIDQTMCWFRHILQSRKTSNEESYFDGE